MTIKEAFFSNETYRRVSWVSLGFGISVSAVSNYQMIIFGPEIFTKLAAGKLAFSISTSATLQGFLSLFGASLCTITLGLAGRRILVLTG